MTLTTLLAILMLIQTGNQAITQTSQKTFIPRYQQSYGRETTQKLIQGCIDEMTDGRGPYTTDSVLMFCSCHISILEDIITWDDQKKLTSEDRVEMIGNIVSTCIDAGFGPELKKTVIKGAKKLDIGLEVDIPKT